MRIKVVTLNEDLYKNINDKYKDENPELIVPIGGDGTFIYAIQQNLEFLKKRIPIFGVANGTLNFLMNKYEYSDINNLLEKISNKTNIEYISTSLLHYYINNEFKGVAVNEVVFGDSIREYPTIDLHYNDVFERFQGSMVSISSPIGSTGLNKNIQGVIIPRLDYDIMNVNTIAASKEIHDRIPNQKIFITQHYNRADIPIVVDNKIVHYMKDNDVLMVELGQKIIIGYNDLKAFEEKRILSMLKH